MEALSNRINSLPVSATLAMAAKARELKNQGVDVIGLSLGEPDFNTPEFIKEAAVQAVHDNWNSYSPVDGYADLKEAICEKFRRDNKIQFKPSQIVISTGAKQSIANVCMVLLNPGDEVLLPAPYWVSYSAIATLAEAKSVLIPSTIDTDFKITPAQLEAAITPKTKLIMFNSPNNPSGTIYTEAEYRALGKVLEKHPDIYILSDEIYEHINYGTPHFSIAAIPELYDRTITVNGVAKAFAMTGWRIGYIGAPDWIAKACNKMQGQITSGANCIAQRATIAAVSAPVSKIQYMVDEFAIRRELIINLLSEIPGIKLNQPQGAFYVLKLDNEPLDFFNSYGHVPLPPYIKRPDEEIDKSRYATIYENKELQDSVAAPTAGLHFTAELLEAIKNKGVEVLKVNLSVGAGTFQPVKAEDIKDHKIHSEYAHVSDQVVSKILDAKSKRKKVTAVGTTVTRALESAFFNRNPSEFKGYTELYITPGYSFKAIDRLITNFHLPKSSLLMLVAAFVGMDEMKDLYNHAVKNQYRFLSYGDAMMINKKNV